MDKDVLADKSGCARSTGTYEVLPVLIVKVHYRQGTITAQEFDRPIMHLDKK
jgi:hypothetical protein